MKSKDKIIYILKLSLTESTLITGFLLLGFCNFGLLIESFITIVKIGSFIAIPLFLIFCVYNSIILQKAERKEITNDKN